MNKQQVKAAARELISKGKSPTVTGVQGLIGGRKDTIRRYLDEVLAEPAPPYESTALQILCKHLGELLDIKEPYDASDPQVWMRAYIREQGENVDLQEALAKAEEFRVRATGPNVRSVPLNKLPHVRDPDGTLIEFRRARASLVLDEGDHEDKEFDHADEDLTISVPAWAKLVRVLEDGELKDLHKLALEVIRKTPVPEKRLS